MKRKGCFDRNRHPEQREGSVSAEHVILSETKDLFRLVPIIQILRSAQNDGKRAQNDGKMAQNDEKKTKHDEKKVLNDKRNTRNDEKQEITRII